MKTAVRVRLSAVLFIFRFSAEVNNFDIPHDGREFRPSGFPTFLIFHNFTLMEIISANFLRSRERKRSSKVPPSSNAFAEEFRLSSEISRF